MRIPAPLVYEYLKDLGKAAQGEEMLRAHDGLSAEPPCTYKGRERLRILLPCYLEATLGIRPRPLQLRYRPLDLASLTWAGRSNRKGAWPQERRACAEQYDCV